MKNRRIFESIFMLLIFLVSYSEAPIAGLDLEEVQVFAVMPETPPAGSWKIGVRNYREVHFKPYRFIKQDIGWAVFVHRVLDGRHDMQSLIERRLVQ